MTSNYYQEELVSLRESAAEFANAYPTLAPQLSGPRPDPDVERILEGVAYLTGQIRSTLDSGFPEFAQGLLQQIFPHYLRPVPSSTLIQFSPKKILNSVLNMRSGTNLKSTAVDGVSCSFRTCYDVEVLPLNITHIEAESAKQGRSVINLDFEVMSNAVSDWRTDRLRFCVGGDYAGASDIYYLLMRYLEKVEIYSDGAIPDLILGPTALRQVGLEDNESLLPYPMNSFPAYRLIQEYFQIKEKFLFFDVVGLASWAKMGKVKKFSIRFTLKDAPFQVPRLSAERFMLYSSPAVNLFEEDGEPVLLDNRRNEVRIRPARADVGKHQVYSVDKVTGRASGANSSTTYEPLGVSFGAGSNSPIYQVTFKTTQEDIAEPFMMVSYPEGNSLPAKETLAIKLTCTNGDLPTKLRPGDISKHTSDTSEMVEFKNTLPPTDHQAPPSGGEVMWKFLSHLSLNYLPIANKNNLRDLLSLYIFSGGDRKNEIANKRRVDGIENIQIKPADRLVNGALYRGQNIEVTIDKEHFSSQGDLFVFGSVLDRLFSSFSSINVYTFLTVKDANSGELHEWPARLGNRTLI